MKIYDAIIKAAAHIERNPELFDYRLSHIPNCGSPGCAIGWIGHYLGVPRSLSVVTQSKQIIGVEWGYRGNGKTFVERMDAFESEAFGLWRRDAAECARVLRLYAEQYHGHERQNTVTPPDWNTIAGSPLIPDHVQSEEVAHG